MAMESESQGEGVGAGGKGLNTDIWAELAVKYSSSNDVLATEEIAQRRSPVC